ncbi:uncharacterized protein LOC102802770 [Saccoglossus kowalevskii]|uniref:Uncharacterized protein LOC102802770 n=1 Tax=Saccoglossus kowalevskii TaxID=10224 RepID=A0ABM0N0L6_SACKO|nr:PREDICTED: uncharacterized protein LOC102802770 [Saccoglossus kowalevskii]
MSPQPIKPRSIASCSITTRILLVSGASFFLRFDSSYFPRGRKELMNMAYTRIVFVAITVCLLLVIPCALSASFTCINKGVDGAHATNYATCPSGYEVTGCSCGYRCGSYSIQSLGDGRSRCYCHIGCMSGNRAIDWTSARCCRVQPQ